MFWGLIMEPGKRYTQKVERAFHVSMACLEPSTADNENVSVMLAFDKTEFILCNLNKHKAIQTQLDLNFQSGDKIAFMSSGKGRVHLTGYLLETDEEDDMDDEDEDDVGNEISASDSDLFVKKVSNTSKESGKRKNEPQISKAEMKKPKLEEPESDEDMDEDDDDDEDYDDSSEGLDDVLEGSEDEDDDEDDDDEDEDSESEEDEKMVSMSKQKSESKKDKTLSPKEKKQNKSLIRQNKTPNEKEQKSAFFNEKHQKGKTPNEKQQQQQKNKTPNEKFQMSTPKTSPGIEVNGLQSGKKNKKGLDTPKVAKTPNVESPQKKVLEGGVTVEEIKVGNGPVAKPGRQVSVYYIGRLKNNNKQFDSTTQGAGFKFRLGRGEVIKGWDIGVTGMKVGGKRKIVCPPALAYGNKGSPPAIPPNSALVFEV